ncbi:MAG: restriction endonuclease subunit S [Ruminococcaceae bacterium]|nr:restriction endonuclease subunit S [Oscillospiraceae bacterium]
MHYEKFADGSVKCIEEEIPFELPEGWEWTRLGVLFSHNTGKALNSKKQMGTFYTYITTSNVYWNKFELDGIKQMPYTEAELEKCTVRTGDLLVCEGGDIGRAAIWTRDEEIRIQNHIHRLRPYVNLCVKFYYYVFLLYKQTERISGKGIGIQGLSSNQLHALYFPLPPLLEQEEIADKVDNYFYYIDFIESEKTDLQSTIQLAKSKILDLAIRGKLVPQDPNDEPASVLLERIREEKEKLIKQGKIKRDKNESVIFRGEDNSYYEKIGDKVRCIDDEVPFELPEGWEFARLSNICNINPRNDIDDELLTSFVPMSFIGNGFSNTFSFDNRKWKDIKNGFTHFAENDVGFAKITPCFENRKSVIFRNLCNGYGAGTTELYILHPYCNTISPNYLLYLIKSERFINSGKETFSGAVGQQRVGKEFVLKHICPIPPISEQIRIENKVSLLLKTLDNIEESLN